MFLYLLGRSFHMFLLGMFDDIMKKKVNGFEKSVVVD